MKKNVQFHITHDIFNLECTIKSSFSTQKFGRQMNMSKGHIEKSFLYPFFISAQHLTFFCKLKRQILNMKYHVKWPCNSFIWIFTYRISSYKAQVLAISSHLCTVTFWMKVKWIFVPLTACNSLLDEWVLMTQAVVQN